MTTLVKFVIKQGAAPDKSAVFKVSDIEPQFEKSTGVPWDASHLEKPVKLGLLVSKGQGADMTLTFTPSALARTLGCVAAMKKLTGEDDRDVTPGLPPEQESKEAEPLKKAS